MKFYAKLPRMMSIIMLWPINQQPLKAQTTKTTSSSLKELIIRSILQQPY